MVPSLGLILVTSLLTVRHSFQYYRVNLSKPLQATLKMIVLPFLAVLTWKGLAEKYYSLRTSTHHHVSAGHLAGSLSKKGLLITGSYASCWERAVSFGNGYAGGRYSKLLGTQFGHRIEYDIFTGNYFVFSSNDETARIISPKAFFSTNHTVLLQLGWPSLITLFPIQLPPGYQLRSLGGWREEAFFWIGSETNISDFNVLKAEVSVFVAKHDSVTTILKRD